MRMLLAATVTKVRKANSDGSSRETTIPCSIAEVMGLLDGGSIIWELQDVRGIKTASFRKFDQMLGV